MVGIEFTKDFATKKKGDGWECDGQLASQLVHKDKVAKYTEEQSKKFAAIKAKAEAQAKAQKAQRDKLDAAEKARIAKVIKANKKKAKK